jgi:Uma2 family endonuclease
MATATAGSRKRAPASSGFVFHDVSWDDYEAMLKIVGEGPIRVTYDRGTMEIFMPTFGHDSDANSLGRMVDMLTEELGMDMEGGDTTTHKRKDLGKGAEPDTCYWFGDHARLMRGKRRLDLNSDPPPELIIEVDVTHLARSAQDLRRDEGSGGLAIPKPIPPVPPSSAGQDLSATADQPELPRPDRLGSRSVPQGGANPRQAGLDPILPSLRPAKDRPGATTERTVIARAHGPSRR